MINQQDPEMLDEHDFSQGARGKIVSYTVEELDKMITRGESKTDWQRIYIMTEKEIEQNANNDLESPEYPYPDDFWKDTELVSSQREKKPVES